MPQTPPNPNATSRPIVALTVDMQVVDLPGLEDYIRPRAMEYRISERVLAPDSFEVKTLPGKELMFEVKGKLVSFEGVKRMSDRNGRTLFTMTANILTRNYDMALKDLRTGVNYIVRKKGLIPGKGRGTLQVFRRMESNEQELIIEAVTDSFRTNTKILNLETNTEMGILFRKKFTLKRLTTGLDSYVVRVLPGVDTALVIMLAICFDEQYTEGAF